MIKVLFLGEIVAKAGIEALHIGLPTLLAKHNPDFVLVNGNSATGGFGLGKTHAFYIRKMGVDCISLSDNAFLKKDLAEDFEKLSFVIRPMNYIVNLGKGCRILKKDGKVLAFLNYVGITNQNKKIYPLNPFLTSKENIKWLKDITSNIVVNYHTSTTSEKQVAQEFFLSLGVSAVIGTGMKVMTSDCEILDEKTAVISDCGRCGSIDSTGGFLPKQCIDAFTKAMPTLYFSSFENIQVQGVVFEIDDLGNATSIDTINHSVEYTPKEAYLSNK